MTEDAVGSSTMTAVAAAARRAVRAVTGMFRKHDPAAGQGAAAAAADGEATDNARKMKAAVEAARKSRATD